MTIRAKLFQVTQVCRACTGEEIDIGIYQGMQTGLPDISRGSRSMNKPSFTLMHPSGRSLDVTDLVESGTITAR